MAGTGSLLLVPEVLTRPAARGEDGETAALAALLGRRDSSPGIEEVAVTYPSDLGALSDRPRPTGDPAPTG